jgi:hypothetical protein
MKLFAPFRMIAHSVAPLRLHSSRTAEFYSACFLGLTEFAESASLAASRVGRCADRE